ncbi:MAG: hypothetical protein JST92_12405, partial [Deltaproteobacteria bacterium]|nr:hypothetical protein [Deltaproteobacteria bacterium]
MNLSLRTWALVAVLGSLACGGSSTDAPPTVTLTSPAQGATLSGTVTLSAEPHTSGVISSVSFFV